jgi:hypothetical protein
MLNSISVIFSIHQTLSGFSGIQLDSYYECHKNSTKGSHYENQWQEDGRRVINRVPDTYV